jgi:hypothetical protein
MVIKIATKTGSTFTIKNAYNTVTGNDNMGISTQRLQ